MPVHKNHNEDDSESIHLAANGTKLFWAMFTGFGSLIAIAVGFSLWIGSLQEQVHANTIWIHDRNNIQIDSRLATIESRQGDVRDRLAKVEGDFREHELEDNKMFNQMQFDHEQLERILKGPGVVPR